MSSRAVFSFFAILLLSCPALAQDDPGAGDPPAEGAEPTTPPGEAPAAPEPAAPAEPEPAPAPPPSPAPPAEPAPSSPPPDPEPAPVIHPTSTQPAPAGQPTPTATPAQAAEEEDDGRDADFLWLEAGFGYSWADLAAFSNNNFVPGVEQFKGSGYAGHVAAGFKLFLFTLGARGSVATYPTAESPFDLWSVMFDLMLRIPIFFAEPYIRAGIGYAWMGNLDFTSLADSAVRVYGLTIEAGVGLDLYLNPYVSIGGGLDLAFLNLTRQRVDQCMDVGGAMCDIGGVDLSEEGDAVGFQLRATGHIAFHF